MISPSTLLSGLGTGRPGRPASLLPCLLLCLLAASAVHAVGENAGPDERQVRYGDMISLFEDIHVPADTRLRGDVVCIVCDVVIEGEVRDVTVILGGLELTGRVRGSVVGVASRMDLRGAEIDGELVNVLGQLDLEDTRVAREFHNVLGSLEHDQRSSSPTTHIGGFRLPDVATLVTWGRLVRLLGLFVLLVVLAAVAPDRIRRIGEEAPVRYVAAFFVGLLGYLCLLVVVGLLTVTVIGIPFAILGFLVVKWLGIAGIFEAFGRSIGRAIGREMTLLGAVLLAFGLYAAVVAFPSLFGLPGLLLSVVICTLFFLLVEVPGVGLVILTRAGAPRRPDPPPPAAVTIPAPPTGSPDLPGPR